MPLQHGARQRIGFLQVDAPVFQLIERNPRIGHRAAHIGPRRDHAEIAIQILHLRFAMTRGAISGWRFPRDLAGRSEEHTSELQSHLNLVCRLLLEKKKNRKTIQTNGYAVHSVHILELSIITHLYSDTIRWITHDRQITVTQVRLRRRTLGTALKAA